jgi:hypothetical protein
MTHDVTTAGDTEADATAPHATSEAVLGEVMRDPDYLNRTDNPARHDLLVARAMELRQTIAGEGDTPQTDDWRDVQGRPVALHNEAVPASPDVYDLPRPELDEGGSHDEAMEAAARGWFHEAGLSQAEARRAWDSFHAYSLKPEQRTDDAIARARSDSEAALRREWGEAYEAKLRKAKTFVRDVGGERLVALLEETGTGNDPVLIRMAAGLAERDAATLSPERAATELARLMRQPAYLDRGHPDHNALVERVYQIHRRRHG